MKNLKINVDLEELKIPRNSIRGYGKIWVETERFEFPQKNWDDFIFFILSDWNFNICQLLTNKTDVATLSFVDANLAIRFQRIEENNFKISFGEWDKFDDIFDNHENAEKIEINIFDFAKELYRTNNIVIQFVNTENIQSDYYNGVEKQFGKLTTIIHNLGL